MKTQIRCQVIIFQVLSLTLQAYCVRGVENFHNLILFQLEWRNLMETRYVSYVVLEKGALIMF